jgi:energy-coupling factor transporter ATP-binding protein EcfA2
MSHIVEFSVDGLAGRRSPYHQAMQRDLNIFFGNNGSGKTSLLKILHSAIEGNASILENVPFTRAEVKVFSVTFNQLFTRTVIKEPEPKAPLAEADHLISLKFLQTTMVKESKLKWETSPKEPGVSSLSHVYLPISRLYRSSQEHRQFSIGPSGITYFSDDSSGASYSEEELDRRFSESLVNSWRGYSTGISQAVRQAQQKGLANILRAVLSKRRKRARKSTDSSHAYERVSSFLAREPGFAQVLGSKEEFAEKYQRDAELRAVVKDIEEVEQSIKAATAPRERLRELISSMYVGSKEVTFSDTEITVGLKNGKTIGLPFLSSGEKQILYLLVGTLLADINSILIDEPEISMHIDWQKNLVKSMRTLNPRAQIILATHSPEIMADVPDSKIFRL